MVKDPYPCNDLDCMLEICCCAADVALFNLQSDAASHCSFLGQKT